jgi:hypothetical protein
MTRPRKSSPPDQVFAKVVTSGGHDGPPNDEIGLPDQGDPGLIEGSGRAAPLTRSAPLTPAANTTHTAVGGAATDDLGLASQGAQSATQRFLTEEAHDGRVA